MKIKSITKNECRNIPDEVLKLAYVSSLDSFEDWAYIWPNTNTDIWAVVIHGHGSNGDQLYTRPDIRKAWLPQLLEHNVSILTPNLRDSAWMSPSAAGDLHDLLEYLRAEYGAQRFVFYSGSMGGTSNLIYAVLKPRDVDCVVALGAATDLASYYNWCVKQKVSLLDEIADAISSSYGGAPDELPQVYKVHSVVCNFEKLTMPIYISHGTDDEIIPVSQVRLLNEKLSSNKNYRYKEIAGGGHDSPILNKDAFEWVMKLL